jgi:hypothetical protein
MGDSLTAQIDAFLGFKRALGYKYVRAELWLRAFDRFAQQQSVRRRSAPLLDELIRSWLARNAARKPVSVAIELGVMRQFCAYLRRSDPTVIVPTRSWAPQATTSDFLPHILQVPDIKKLLRLAAALGRPRFRARLYQVPRRAPLSVTLPSLASTIAMSDAYGVDDRGCPGLRLRVEPTGRRASPLQGAGRQGQPVRGSDR